MRGLSTSFPTLDQAQRKRSGHRTGHDHNRRPETQLLAVSNHMVRLNRDWQDAKRKGQTERAARIEAQFLKTEATYHFFSAVVEHKGQANG